MNNNEHRDESTWYEPLQSTQPAREAAPVERTHRTRRGWTPWRVLGAIGLVLLVIIGSSLAFASPSAVAPAGGTPTIAVPSDELPAPSQDMEREEPDTEKEAGEAEEKTDADSNEEKTGGDSADEAEDSLPEKFADFFENYYETIQESVADIRIERVELPVAFALQLQPAAEAELSLQELYASCAPSIVGISAYEGDNIGYSWGTGVILSSDGLILTNTHVVDGSDCATVTLSNDEVYPALLVGADAISDVAVLKIEAEGLQPAAFGQSGALRVGDPVAAIGNPLGEEFRSTLTDGIISAIERGINYNGRTMTLLQTNTALNEGNSGGALFNMYGQVIGVTNMKMMSSYSSIEGIGFAIPSSTVENVVNALVRYGEVRGRPAIGITVGSIPESAASHYDLPEGLYISDVSAGSDAEKQGILPGDILTAVNGIPVTTTEEINEIKNKLQVGDTMEFTIWRDGKVLEFRVKLVDTNDIYGK